MKKITMFLMAIVSILALTFASGCASNSETESKPYRSIAEIKKSGELIMVFSATKLRSDI